MFSQITNKPVERDDLSKILCYNKENIGKIIKIIPVKDKKSISMNFIVD